MSRPFLAVNPRRVRAVGPVFARGGGDAAGRLARAVLQARTAPLTFKEADFDHDVWEVTEADAVDLGKPGRTGRRFVRFTPHPPRAGMGVPMPACVRDFAKAYFRRIPLTSLSAMVPRRNAIGIIGLELQARGSTSITECTPHILDGAIARAQAMGKDRSFFGAAFHVASIARTLREHQLTDVPIGEWIPTLRKFVAAPDIESREFSPLPADGYLNDLGAAFRQATNPVDVLLVGALVIQACCWGQRAGSVFMLSEDCAEGLDDGEHLSMRWPTSKGRPEEVIDVPDPVAPFVRTVLERVKTITAEARAIKRWYDACPNALYLPPEIEHVREVGWATSEEAVLLTGLRQEYLVQGFRLKRDIRVEYVPGRKDVVYRLSFPDLERDLLSRLHVRMRDVGGRNAHPLFLLPRHAIARYLAGGHGSCSMFEGVLYQHLYRRLRPASGGSLWERVGVDRPVGDKTHAIRHWFATIGRARGLSEEELARLQRRTSPRQTRSYVHFPDEDFGGLAARTAAVLAAGGDLDAYPTAPASAPTLAAHADALLRSQGLEPRS